MIDVRALGILLLATSLGAFGCAAKDGASTDANASESDLNGGGGFGVDLIFDNMLTTPSVVATADCPNFGIKSGDMLQVLADKDEFRVETFDTGAAVFDIQIPSDGHYVWQGRRPNRITNKVISPSLQIKATLDPDTTDVTLSELNGANACVLHRCNDFGPCQ
jgi:hypothetical protein